MDVFENVSVTKQANVYFGGKVTSRTVTFADGSKKTLGIMLPGEYEFSTQQAEIMEFAKADLEVLLPENSHWTQVSDGDSFNVPANSSFKLIVNGVSDYCCTYLD